MTTEDILKGKRILAVDDEPDILDTLKDTLEMCQLETASSYETAKGTSGNQTHTMQPSSTSWVSEDSIFSRSRRRRKIPALMLTAHGLNPDNLVGSIKLGAKSYIPKDKMFEIDVYLREIFLAKEKGIEKTG